MQSSSLKLTLDAILKLNGLVLSRPLDGGIITSELRAYIASRKETPIPYGFFFAVLWSDIDTLDQEPGFFPGFVSTLFTPHDNSPLSLLVLEPIASSNGSTVFEAIVIPKHQNMNLSTTGLYTIGLLRVPTRLIPSGSGAMKLPQPRLGEITAELEVGDWDPIRNRGDGELVASFPPQHATPLSHRWDYRAGEGMEIPT